MKLFISLFVCLVINIRLVSQSNTTTVPDNTYHSDGRKTITTGTNKDGNAETTITWTGLGGNTRERITITKTEEEVIVYEEFYDIEQRKECGQTTKLNAEGKIIEHNITIKSNENRGGVRIEAKRTDSGELKGKYEYGYGEPFFKSAKELEKMELEFHDRLKKIGAGDAAKIEPKQISCDLPRSGCKPKAELFAGYSFISGDYGLDKESFPAGIRVAAVYNLTNHIAVGVDASLNTRKIGSENLSRSFIMIEGKYVLGDMDDCDRKLFGNIRLLGGIGIEKYGPSSGSGPAFGGGAGIIRLVTKKVAVRGQVDYLAVKYKGSDELNKNLRLSGGFVFRF